MRYNFCGRQVFKFLQFNFMDGDKHGCTNLHINIYFAGLTFVDWQVTTKTVKIGPLEISYYTCSPTVICKIQTAIKNLRVYGILIQKRKVHIQWKEMFNVGTLGLLHNEFMLSHTCSSPMHQLKKEGWLAYSPRPLGYHSQTWNRKEETMHSYMCTSRVSIQPMHASGRFKNDTEEIVYQCLVPREERMHVIEGN